MEEVVKSIMSSILEINSEDISSLSSPDNIESWDSLRHLLLITAVEEEFNILFNNEEVQRLLSFKDIVEIVAEKLKN